jgi:hypothetical protein
LIVAALIASAGVIRICEQAMETTSGIEHEGALPGLKSVASATATPCSIMRLAGAKSLEPSPKVVPGRSTAIV